MKTCRACAQTKPFSEFHQRRDSVDGHRSQCKECRKTPSKEYSQKNSEKEKARVRAWAVANPEKYKQTMRACGQVWRKNNPERVKELGRIGYLRNQEKRVATARNYRDENRDKTRAACIKYQKNHRYVKNAIDAKRRALKKKACVPWADLGQIKTEYALAKWCSDVMASPYHVDHIIPLVNKFVCGLHVPLNLRVIPAADNQRKHNHYWPDLSPEQVEEMAESFVEE